MTKQGKVYLIGAGPGDPGLLGLKAKECLQTADAVVYDRLADPRILAFARKDAEMVYVGKASANHTMRQPDINKLLVKLAAAATPLSSAAVAKKPSNCVKQACRLSSFPA